MPMKTFEKKSVELLSKKDETTACQLTSVHKVRACFKNAALLFNREKVAYDKAIQTMDAEQFASWGEHRNRLKQMLDFCSENPNSVMKAVLTGPHFSTVSILNEKEASTICDIFSIETQNIEKSDRNRILLNTFVDYCSKNPSSFLNRTCMPLFKIFLGKATINGTKNVESQVNILQKTISNYFRTETFSKFLDGETSFQTISLDKMHSLFHSLETAYQEKERQSLLNYLNRLRERGQLIES